jgi:hypothetical protein
MEEITYCCNCQYIIKPTGAPYMPHPLSLCAKSGGINFVTGEKVPMLCKDINLEGHCTIFKKA